MDPLRKYLYRELRNGIGTMHRLDLARMEVALNVLAILDGADPGGLGVLPKLGAEPEAEED